MNFQENKFPIILGTGTALVTGFLLYWGMKSNDRYAEAKLSYETSASTISRLMRGSIQPTAGNVRAKTQAVAAYADSVEELQQAFDPLRQPELQNIKPKEYTDALLAARKRIMAKFEEGGTTMAESFFLGHGEFSDKLPPRRNTGVLKFELDAFEDLLGRLAAARPSVLNNVYWPGIPEVPEDATFVAHPIEVTFTGPESSLRQFLEAIGHAEDHYFVIRSMRVSNDRNSPPSARDARFESETPAATGPEPAGAEVFEDFFPDAGTTETTEPGDEEAVEVAPVEEEPQAETPTDESEILKQVLGEEEIHVFMRIDVMQILEPRELP